MNEDLPVESQQHPSDQVTDVTQEGAPGQPDTPVGQGLPSDASTPETPQHRGPKRAGYTKNKGKGQSKTRRRMAHKSQQINRKRARA